MEIVPVKLTIVARFKNFPSLEALYRLIILLKIDDFIFKETMKIPYFGIDDVFVSLKTSEWGSRGVRCQTITGVHSGSMKNCVSADFQREGTNYNVKIYHNLFHIGGISSLETGMHLSNIMMDKIIHYNELWKPFFALHYDDRINFINNVLMQVVSNEGVLLKINDPLLDEKFDALEKNEMTTVLSAMITFLDFYFDIDEYYTRMIEISNLPSVDGNAILLNGDLSIMDYEILESIYTGKLNVNEIVLEYVARRLHQMGYDVTFHNEKGRSIKVISQRGIEDYKIKKTSSKIPMHQISISDDGNVRINSPGYYELINEVTIEIVNIIFEILREEEYPKTDIDSVVTKMHELVSKNNTSNIQPTVVVGIDDGDGEFI